MRSHAEETERYARAATKHDLAVQAEQYLSTAQGHLGLIEIAIQVGERVTGRGEIHAGRPGLTENGHPDPRLNLALTLEQAGQTDEAIRTYKTALEVYPGHLPTVEALARICVVQHRDSEELAGWLDTIAMQGETDGWRKWARGARTRPSLP